MCRHTLCTDMHMDALSIAVTRTGLPCFTVPRFTALCTHYVFYKLKVCDNPASGKSIGAISPTAFAQCLCVTFW